MDEYIYSTYMFLQSEQGLLGSTKMTEYRTGGM
jgi:hypothetical protein